MRETIASLIENIAPFDSEEERDINDALDWIHSGAPLFRTQKPNIPHKHLVSYCVPWDKKTGHILLIDHIKAQIWIPPGGHVDPEEHPATSARRELQEELNLNSPLALELPLFLTVTHTTGIVKQHIDVSLWYLFETDQNSPLKVDFRECNGVNWCPITKPPKGLDPQLLRFMKKLELYSE